MPGIHDEIHETLTRTTAHLHWPHIIRGCHDVLCQDLDPVEVPDIIRRTVIWPGRWRGQKSVQEMRIGNKHRLHNRDESRPPVCVRSMSIAHSKTDSVETHRQLGLENTFVYLPILPEKGLSP